METTVEYKWSDANCKENPVPKGNWITKTSISKKGVEATKKHFIKQYIYAWSEDGGLGKSYFDGELNKWIGLVPIKWCGIPEIPEPIDIELNAEYKEKRRNILSKIRS